MIDELLGPLLEQTIDDGEGGQWIVGLRPRFSGPRITRTTVIRFRRSGRRNGFGVRLHVLQAVRAHGIPEQRDPIIESSIYFTKTLALNALAWIDTLDETD